MHSNRQHTLIFLSSGLSSQIHVSWLLYLMQHLSTTLLAPVSKIYCFRITFLSYALHITVVALVPIVKKIQNDLFHGGKCGDEVLFFVSMSKLYAVNVSCNAGPLCSSSCVPWCYGILDSRYVSLSSFKILIDNLCCRWKVSIIQVSPFNFF